MWLSLSKPLPTAARGRCRSWVTAIVTVLVLNATGAAATGAAAASSAEPAAIEIGRSALGRPILAYQVGEGPIKRALVGGIHGGYELNTIALMSATLEHLRAHPDVVPDQVTLFIIPVLNPDGYAAGTDRVKGRMNGNGVDLNRNWDYAWRRDARHGRWPVSGGEAPFSEPETRALRDFIFGREIGAVVVYHSAFDAVFAGAGRDESNSAALARAMARATGYRLMLDGMPGQMTTGCAVDWLSTRGVDAVEIELTDHTNIELGRNLAGVRAFVRWQAPGN